jgi:nucleoside-diphosphate-sugar epimerase
MPTVSVTGATGFVGWHVCETFRDAGWIVRAIVRPGTQKPVPAGIDIRPAALVPATPRLEEALAGSDVVVHAAGLVRSRRAADFQAVNVGGTQAIVNAANAADACVLLISSQAAVGTGTIVRPSREDDPPRPVTAYGRSKLAAEDAVRQGARRPWTIIRPPAVYGPRDTAFLPLFRMASRGWFLRVTDGAFPFSLVHVRDLARAIVLVASRVESAGETFFVAQAAPVTADAWLEQLALAFGRASRPRRMPAALVKLAASAGDIAWTLGITPPFDRTRLAEFGAEGFVCTPDRVKRVLGFSTEIPVEVGVAETARWYRAQGWL